MSDRPHHFVTGGCGICGAVIAFDPARVPALSLNAKGELITEPDEEVARSIPMCRECTQRANANREEAGLAGRWFDDPDIWGPVEGFPE